MTTSRVNNKERGMKTTEKHKIKTTTQEESLSVTFFSNIGFKRNANILTVLPKILK